MVDRARGARAFALAACVGLSAVALDTSAYAAGPRDAPIARTAIGMVSHAGAPAESDGLDGDPLEPGAAGTRRLRAAQEGGVRAPSVAQDTLPPFTMADQPTTDVPPDWWPYRLSSAVGLGQGPRDAENVKMYSIGGTLYDHPVKQAQDGLQSVESYRLTRDPRYLDQALADAHRLVQKRVESRGAWFYPYPFDFALHGDPNDVIATPWYSAMAQGQALSLFVRLNDMTQDDQWLTAARMTLASFDLPPVPSDPSVPFVSWVDGEGHLWLELYPQQPLTKADRTINGPLFASFGVWDAVRVFGDDRARQLFAGSSATTRANLPQNVREPLWISKYCLRHEVRSPTYHAFVVDALNTMQGLTGSSAWSVFSDQLRDDYPAPQVSGAVDLAAGRVSAYQYDSAGAITRTKTVSLSRASSAPADLRQRIHGHGIAYRITSGWLAGYWVTESYPSTRLRGVYSGTRYPMQRTAVFGPGVATAYHVTEPSGALSSPVSVTFTSRSTAPFDRSAWIGGRPYVHITKGVFLNRWVPSGGLQLQ